MEYITSIKDTIYPASLSYKKRNAVRGIILTNNNEIVLMHINTQDIFGKRDHYELPGGGIKQNEDGISALKREIKEETGFIIDNISEVGIIDIQYNPLNRIDIQHYYKAQVIDKVLPSLTNYEKDVFENIVFVPIENITNFYNTFKTEGVGKLIHTRDLIAIKKALNI